MPDEQSQQDPQPTTQEAPATSGESFPSVTGMASTQANPDRPPSNPATAESPSGQLTEQPPAYLNGCGSEGAGGAGAGESSSAPVADALTPANVTVNQAASPIPISNGETLGSADAPAVAQPGEAGSQLAAADTEAGAGSAMTSVDAQQESAALATGITKTPHHSALEELVGAIRRSFNMLGGELGAAVRKAEDLL